jgi:oxygen-independent coproporphyrinogen-3 oxidase
MLARSKKSTLPRWRWPRAAYVHIPFCAHHCGYCDFAIATGQDDRIGSYLDALATELAMLGQPQPVETLFLGGGTPTHLSAPQLERLLGTVLAWLPLAPGHEFSVEANPGTLGPEKISVLADHGVNRVSLGVQSFQSNVLSVLEREHVPADVPRAMDQIRQRMANVSLDLIFGAPGQTVGAWVADLERALALEPLHLSTYGLTYEKGTRLWKQRERGQVRAVGEEAELTMYLEAMNVLEAAGFEHYEISSFARPGRRCRHNQVYWANEAYFGFGMGAARYVEGRRELNTRDLTTYIRTLQAGELPTFQSEQLGGEERARETISLNLRRAEGVERERFTVQTGFNLDDLAGPAVERNVERGLLEDNGKHIKLTRPGKCVADAVIAELM